MSEKQNKVPTVPSSVPLEEVLFAQKKRLRMKHYVDLPWPGGSAWISQRFSVAPSGGCRGGPPPGWPGCRTGFWLGCCRPLEKDNQTVTDES